MTRQFRQLALAWKALTQLGPRQVGLFASYQLILRSGVLRRLSVERRAPSPLGTFHPLLSLPDRQVLSDLLAREEIAKLKAEADEIIGGRVHLFGGEALPLDLTPPPPQLHWTDYERHHPPYEDFKLIWEAARFGWAFTLGRAYQLLGDERYAAAFWGYAEAFWDANPPNRGPHWVSAQEVALRLTAFAFAAQVFAPSASSTPPRLERLLQSIADHAARIPPTLIYARAQHNNHLLSEAAGLITAAQALPEHPQSRRWQAIGEKWLAWGLEHQIAADGAYCQHSANYHRLMLQWVLWVNAICPRVIHPLRSKIAQAVRWLLALCDPLSGRLPNLGPNDGAYIFPLTNCPFADYRPVLQAAARAFLGQPAFGPGLWDEMSLWFGMGKAPDGSPLASASSSHVLRLTHHDSWAYLRAVRFTSRPGHADQLHLDLWWRGWNVAQDAGSYRYSAAPPWDNRLSGAFVHNTITVNGRDQMTRAGKFLYLDWAQAEIIERQEAADGSWQRIVAQHDGYRRLGIIHRRAVTAFEDGRWQVEDTLMPLGGRCRTPLACRLHWLLPDWPYEWQIVDHTLRLHSPYGWITLRLKIHPEAYRSTSSVQLMRAGELLFGSGVPSPILGWTSPTYGHKMPALSFVGMVEQITSLPLYLTTEWTFPPRSTET